MLNEALKSCKKVISADVKPAVKQQEIKEVLVVSFNFLKKYLEKNLKCNVKQVF